MVPALCKAHPFFGQVALRVVIEGEAEQVDVSMSPEQAKALAKQITKAARAVEKGEK